MITKRILGIGLAILGSLAIFGVLVSDRIIAGREAGLGLLQQIGLTVALVVLVIGITLIPLGDRPA